MKALLLGIALGACGSMIMKKKKECICQNVIEKLKNALDALKD